MSEQRTLQQNKALHKYLRSLAEALNDAGYDMRRTLKPDAWLEAEIPWNCEMAKRFLWGPIQKAMTDEDSTTEMDTREPSEIYETLNRMTAEKFGISVPWPSIEEMRRESLAGDGGLYGKPRTVP